MERDSVFSRFLSFFKARATFSTSSRLLFKHCKMSKERLKTATKIVRRVLRHPATEFLLAHKAGKQKLSLLFLMRVFTKLAYLLPFLTSLRNSVYSNEKS